MLADTSGVKWSTVAAVFRSDLSCPLRIHPPVGPDLPKLLRRQTCLLSYKTRLVLTHLQANGVDGELESILPSTEENTTFFLTASVGVNVRTYEVTAECTISLWTTCCSDKSRSG